MSHQQNPSTQQTSSQPAADVKPFSIRHYVDASRHKNIFNSWPFPDKYLKSCLNLGLKDVLPPFRFQTSSLKGCSNLMHSQNDSKEAEFCKTHEVHQHVIEHQQNIKNELEYSLSHAEGYKLVTNKHILLSYDYEEGNQSNSSTSINLSKSADTLLTLPSSSHDVHKKAMKGKQHRRGRKKSKKRSMMEILAVARECTLEEIYRMNKFSYTADNQQMMPVENIYKSEAILMGGRSEDQEAANDGDMTEKGALVLKFKLNGCNVNWNSGT